MPTATLNGHTVTVATVQLPAWGRWFADVAIDGEQTLSGAVKLVIADATFAGAILSGGSSMGRSSFRVCGGAGWGKVVPSKNYRSDADVKLSTVAEDAARLAGETLGDVPRATIGKAWTRPDGEAARTLEALAPKGWRVDADGVTRFGRRSRTELARSVTKGKPDRARGTIEIATDSIVDLAPGVVVDGIEAVDVVHELGDGKLRTTLFGSGIAATSRRLDALAKLVDLLDPGRAFRGVYEFRVTTQEGTMLNLQPTRASSGMPTLRRVPVRPGVPGAKAMFALGAKVVVGFLDQSPARPVVLACEDEDGDGFVPLSLTIDATTVIKLADGVRPMAATGDLAAGLFPVIGTTRVMG